MSLKTDYRHVLVVTCLSTSLVPLMGSSLNLALPAINASFSLSARHTGWILTSYLLSTAIFQIPCARMSEIFGRRRIYLCGLALFSAFSVMSAMAHSGEALVVYRFLSGIGSAMIFSTNLAIITSVVPLQRRGWALGINSATVYFSLSLGPFVGGFLTQSLGWHSIFLIAAFMGALAFCGAAVFVKDEWKSENGRGFDWLGTLVYALGLSSLICGFSMLPHVYGFALSALGLALIAFFAFYETRAAHPVFNVSLILKNRVFAFSSLSSLINYSATTSAVFMLSIYLQYVRALTPIEAGAIIVCQSVIMALASLRAGRLSDRFSASKVATFGMFFSFLGLLSFCAISEGTNFVFIALSLFVMGLGFGIFSSPNTNVVMSSVGPKDYAQAAATMGTVRLVGQSLSMGIAMMAVSFNMGNKAFSPALHAEITESMRMSFAIGAAFCLAGIYFSSVRVRAQSAVDRAKAEHPPHIES